MSRQNVEAHKRLELVVVAVGNSQNLGIHFELHQVVVEDAHNLLLLVVVYDCRN